MEKLRYKQVFLYEAGSGVDNYELEVAASEPFRIGSIFFELDGSSTVDFTLKLHKAMNIAKYSGDGTTTATNVFGDSETTYLHSDRLNGYYDDPLVITLIDADTLTNETVVEYDLDDLANQYAFIEDGDILEFVWAEGSAGVYGDDIPVVIHGI